MRTSLRVVIAFVVLTSSACGVDPFGYSRHYQPLDEEEQAVAGAVEWDPVMAERRSEQWSQRSVMLFGIVERVNVDAQGGALVVLSQRSLEPRNLCGSSAEDSCRVTVSDREHGRIEAYLNLTPEALQGPRAVRKGSLLRVVGDLQAPRGEANSLPRLKVRYTRHWPAKFFVTTSARSFMKR